VWCRKDGGRASGWGLGPGKEKDLECYKFFYSSGRSTFRWVGKTRMDQGGREPPSGYPQLAGGSSYRVCLVWEGGERIPLIPRLISERIFQGRFPSTVLKLHGKYFLANDLRKLAEFRMAAYARIAGFDYHLRKMQAELIRRVLAAKPSG
jgi:hypothetical protein